VKLLGAARAQELLEVLPEAISGWEWSIQDLAISELARQNVPGLGLVLLQVLPKAHLYVVPMIIDQLGSEGDPAAVPYLIEIAAGENERLRDVFIRIKSIEALGRMRAVEAALLLRTILRKRNGLTYAEPAGLRSAAEEALEHLEGRLPVSQQHEEGAGSPPASVSFARARRYVRYPLESPWRARIEGPQPAAARVRTISMGGACLQSSRRLQIGDSFPVEIKSGLRTIHSMAVVRNVQSDGSGVEFVHMDSDDREKLRRILKGLSKD
jgi:HEAT repeat protein